ncbi:hypothetical protein [Catenovulum agarivorans]|uniref:hypothetical protein n=1 Tax=Catenovulum agarivorans TaxID=1172192 RepID=UPI000362D6E7|nr:hypothetical protein [Catenovulum agarivorans]
MKLTIPPYGDKNVTITERWFIVLSTPIAFEFSSLNASDVTVDSGDMVDCQGDVRGQARIRNITDSEIEIDFVFSKQEVKKNAANVPLSIGAAVPLDIKSLPAFQVEATVAAASTASDSVPISINAGATVLVLAANPNRHKAIIGRGEADLYNIKLGYNNATSAQNGIIFGADATAKIDVKAAVYAHNHSPETQTVIVTDTEIDTGA